MKRNEPKKRGRKAYSPEDKMVTRSIRARLSQWVKFDEIGGGARFRAWIDRAKVRDE